MSRRKSGKSGGMGAAYFGIALGAGILVGAGIAVMLLELGEYARKVLTLARRERELARMMVDVVSDFSGFGAGVIPGRGGGGSPEASERIRQRFKTRLRSGGAGLEESEHTREMDLLYSEIDPGLSEEES